MDELVQLEPEEAFATITSLLVADVDKNRLAALFSDCADAANTRGNRENERMFLLAELVTGGTSPTTANFEEIRSRANMMLALHEQQKLSPRMAESPPKVEPAAAEAKALAESPTAAPSEVALAESPAVSPAAAAEASSAAPEPQVRRRTRKKK
ncbi:MAG: hypothetical protein IPM54_10385 [Polyangiaceae bacterium]|nr:hypothetical protein [Polyangiaceae bacterium]